MSGTIEQDQRYLDLYTEQARSLANELSEARDDRARAVISDKLDRARANIEFYRKRLPPTEA